MLDGVEVRGVGRQKHQVAASGLHQPFRGRGLMKPGVVQHDHTAGRQSGQENFFEVQVYHLRVATALKDHRGHQLAVLAGRDDAGTFPPPARNGLINPFASGSTSVFTIQTVIHAAFVQVKDGAIRHVFEFAAKQPSLDFVPFSIFYEFFLM